MALEKCQWTAGSAHQLSMICANVYDEILREEFLLEWGVQASGNSITTLPLSVSFFELELEFGLI